MSLKDYKEGLLLDVKNPLVCSFCRNIHDDSKYQITLDKLEISACNCCRSIHCMSCFSRVNCSSLKGRLLPFSEANKELQRMRELNYSVSRRFDSAGFVSFPVPPESSSSKERLELIFPDNRMVHTRHLRTSMNSELFHSNLFDVIHKFVNCDIMCEKTYRRLDYNDPLATQVVQFWALCHGFNIRLFSNNREMEILDHYKNIPNIAIVDRGDSIDLMYQSDSVVSMSESRFLTLTRFQESYLQGIRHFKMVSWIHKFRLRKKFSIALKKIFFFFVTFSKLMKAHERMLRRRESHEMIREMSWADEMIELEEKTHDHDECDQRDHDEAFEIIKNNAIDAVIHSMCTISFNKTYVPLSEVRIIHKTSENITSKPIDLSKKTLLATSEFVNCECEIYCEHRREFKKNNVQISKAIENISDVTAEDSRKMFYISQYAHLMSKGDIQDLLGGTLSQVLEKLKSFPSFEDAYTDDEQLLLNPKYFREPETTSPRFVLDTNIFISHMFKPMNVPIKMSATVMYEMIKLKKHNSAYKRFFEFHFSSPDVTFPKKSFDETSPVYYDENILKELDENDILVTDDVKLRQSNRGKFMSFSSFKNHVSFKLPSKLMGLSPSASLYFTGSFNWSIKPAKMVNHRFFFDPVKPETFSNELITFQGSSSTPIDLPEFNSDESFEIPEIDHDPLQDVSQIEHFDPEFINRIKYDFPYSRTKHSRVSFDDYLEFLSGYNKKHNTDEIFPIEISNKAVLEHFVADSGLKRRGKIIKRSTDIFLDSLGLKFRFEKESGNDDIRSVQSDDRVSRFLEKNSEIFTNNLFVIGEKPHVTGPFDVGLEEKKYPACVRSLRLLSKLFEDMVYQFGVKMKQEEIIVRDNGLPFGFILYPGRGEKTLKTIRTYRLFFDSQSEGVWEPEASYGRFSVTRCYTESLEDIKHKSELFDNLYPILIRDLMTPKEFMTLFYHMFWSNSSSKKQLGFLKYYTVISESSYSSLPNLVKKYLYNPYKREIHFHYQRKMFTMISENMTSQFKSIFSKSHDIFDFIDSNSIFVYNKKTGQNRFHSFKQFVTDIDDNCNKFEEKFTGVHCGHPETMSGKFVHLPTMKQALKLFKEKLNSRNITVENILERFKEYFVEDFGVFKSSSGGLDMNDGYKKKKCIETYLSELENQNEFNDEFSFVLNCLNKDADETLLGLTKKPQAEGSNREIYVSNIKRRCQLYVVQTFFKVLCKFSDVDMVVENQFNKFEMIQDSSLSESKKSFLNADMGKWSPQDCKEKFQWCLEILIQLDLVPTQIMGLLRKCLKDSLIANIIIPIDFASSSFYQNFKKTSRRSFELIKIKGGQLETMSMDYGWPQGMFHNISSFIHSCSCDLSDKILKSMNPNIKANKFFVSSDDKNLVTTYQSEPSLEELRLVMEVTDKVSNAFSLESSATKNSISTSLTEMISVINVNGTIVYSPMKTLASMATVFDDQDFIKNHKNILSRVCNFFGMSNRLEMSERLYAYYTERLCGHYKLEKDFLAPVSAFGMKVCSVLEYHRGSEHYDNMCKFFYHPQQVYDFLVNVKKMKVKEETTSKRLKRLLERQAGLIQHYKHEMNKSQFEINVKFVLGMEYDSIATGKKRMFLEKSDCAFNSYYYKSNAAQYLYQGELYRARNMINVLSRPSGEEFECNNLVYRSRSVAKLFLDYRNVLSSFEKQYNPYGKLHYLKERSYEMINSSFNELLMFMKNPFGTKLNPKYSRKVSSYRRDITNTCKSLKISTIEQFENSREDFEELKSRSKSNLHFRLQHNGDFETLDYKFERVKRDIINPSFIVENLEFIYEPVKDSRTLRENLKQIMNTMVYNIKVTRMSFGNALNVMLYQFKEMSKHYKHEFIDSVIMNMSDIFQLLNLHVNPDSNFKFKNRGVRRMEWEEITNNLSSVRVKEGLRDIAIAAVDESSAVLVFEKEIPNHIKKVIRADNLTFETDQQRFRDLTRGFENSFLLNSESPNVTKIEVTGKNRLYLEFSGRNFRTKKLIPISKVKKDHVTVSYVSLDKYMVTLRKIGNDFLVHGNDIVGDHNVNLDLSLKTSLSKDHLKQYKEELEDEFKCKGYLCLHRNGCDFSRSKIEGDKYLLICSKSAKWRFFSNSEMVREMKEKNLDEEVNSKLNSLGKYEASEVLEEIYCKSKLFHNGKDLLNVMQGRLTFTDSLRISNAIRKNLLYDVEKNKNFFYDRINKSIQFCDGENSHFIKPPEALKVKYFKLDEDYLSKLQKLSDPELGIAEKMTTTTTEKIPERYKQLRKKHYELMDLEKKAREQTEHSSSGFLTIIDDINQKRFIRNFPDHDCDDYKEQPDSEDESFEMIVETQDECFMCKAVEQYQEKKSQFDINELEDNLDEDLKDFFHYETDLYYERASHEEDCEEDFCTCLTRSFDPLLEKYGPEAAIREFLKDDSMGMKREYLSARYFPEAIPGSVEKIYVSCQCTDTFDCLCKEINESEDEHQILLDATDENFKDFVDVIKDIEGQFGVDRKFKIKFNDTHVFIPYLEATYRDAKSINRELYLENNEMLSGAVFNMSEIFHEIDIVAKESMDEHEVEAQIFDQLEKQSKKLQLPSETNETSASDHMMKESDFMFYEEIQKPKIESLEFKKRRFDDVSERVLERSHPSISDSIAIFGIDPKDSFERRKNATKFNTFSETTLTGFKNTNSEIFDETRKFDDLKLDCSKSTALQAYVAYVFVFKKMTEFYNRGYKKIVAKLTGLKNSLNLYLVANKDQIELDNLEAFHYVYENVEKSQSLKKTSFLKTLMGDSIVNMESVKNIFTKLGRLDDFNLMI